MRENAKAILKWFILRVLLARYSYTQNLLNVIIGKLFEPIQQRAVPAKCYCSNVGGFNPFFGVDFRSLFPIPTLIWQVIKTGNESEPSYSIWHTDHEPLDPTIIMTYRFIAIYCHPHAWHILTMVYTGRRRAQFSP